MTAKLKKGDKVKLRVTHGHEDATVLRKSKKGLVLIRPDGRRITAWLWEDGIAHLSPQPMCSQCGKLFNTERGIDIHHFHCPKKPPKPTEPKFGPRPTLTGVPESRGEEAARHSAYLAQEALNAEVARLERALGEPIEAAERGPHRSFKMRGPGDLAGEWYLLIGAVWDTRDGLQVVLRRNVDKLCRVVHFSWLLPENES